jgi:predicted glycoside hydrolase/deacetylase ChbG (UPF0249 family)
VTTLAQRLGHPADAKLLIIHADDLGFCHSANVGTYDSLRRGLATSASLIVPGPWAREAAARYRGEDIGVQLTVNAEHELYRWGPITQAPSLLGGDGGFPRTMEDVWEHADLDEVRRECRAQIERAILWGFDVSHLNTHMATLQLRPEFFDVYLDLAVDFALPMRMPGSHDAVHLGFPARDLATEAGVVFPDEVVHASPASRGPGLEEIVAHLSPGVTEVHLHPAVDSDELRALAADWDQRVAEHRALCDEPAVRSAVEASGATLIGFRALHELARDARIPEPGR